MTRMQAAARRAALTAAILVPVGLANADVVESTWTGAVDLDWTNPLNWSPSDFFPDDGAGGDTYLVFIDGAPGMDSTVELGSTVSISGLTVDPGDRIDLLNNTTLRFAGDVVNDGTIELGATTNLTRLVVSPSVITLGGSGEVRMTNPTLDQISGDVFGNLLINGPDHAIRGGGSLGANVVVIENQGLIEATDGLTLTVDSNSNASVNSGTLRATDGGQLLLKPGSFDGTGGLIEATAGSEVVFEGGGVAGGTLDTSGDGAIRIGSGNAILENVVNLGLVEVDNNRRLTLSGAIANDGTIRTNADVNVTDIVVGTSELVVDGPGEFVLGGNASLDRITGNSFGFGLTNGPAHTIRGGGLFGVNVIDLTNEGLIVADDPDGELVVDPNLTLVNAGTMRAADGAVMRLNPATYDNISGLIEVEDGGTLQLAGSIIFGGDVQTTGTGIARVVSGNANMEDLSFLGQLEVENTRTLNLFGTIVNEGSIRTAAGPNVTQVAVGGPGLTLDGSGEIRLGGNESLDRLTGLVFGLELVNGASHTIRGGGSLGVNVIDITNEGLIVADDPDGDLRIDPNLTLVNLGTVRAESGSAMRLVTGTYENTGGLIEAADGAEVLLSGSIIVGGELQSTGSGMVRVTTSNATLEDLTLTGQLEVENGRSLNLAGTVVNDGEIRLAAESNVTQIQTLAPAATVGGTGEIVLGGMASLDRITGSAFGNDLFNGPAHTIRGGGLIGSNVVDVFNQGAILADDPAGMLTVDANATLENTGLMRATAEATMSIPASTFTQAGDLVVDAGGAINRNGTITQTAGTTLVDGVLTMTSGILDVQGGTLRGTGTVVGDVANGGFVQPGAAEDFAIGTLTVDGNVDQAATGTLFIQIGKAGHDQLQVTGTAGLGGSLLVGFEKNFVPVIGTQYTIIDATEIQGQFIFANCPAGYVIDYGDEEVVITIAEGISIADLDCNGIVDFNDLLLLLPGWGACPDGGVPCRADLDASGFVDFNDLLILLGAWS